MPLSRQQLQQLPKVEHHRHLDGSLRLETIFELSKHHNLKLGELKPERFQILSPLKDLQTALDCFWNMQKVMCSYEAIKRITFENVEDAYRDGVKAAELRFSPTFIAEGKNLQNDEIIEAVIDGMSEGMRKYPLQVALIGIVSRGLDFDKSFQSLHDLIKYKKSMHINADRILGFDLADCENHRPKSDFLPMVELARQNDLQITIHSGENTTAQDVLDTLEVLSPSRIGHGIQIAKDPQAMQQVKQKQIVLEICPTSNWLTNSVPSIKQHPLPQLLKAGICLSLNSDDPQLMNIDLVHEYEVAQDQLGLSGDDFTQINRQALKSSFFPTEIKKSLEKFF